MTTTRIDARFAALKAEGRAAFVPYVMAGDPDAATALKILQGLPGAGADIIEVGFPFSDPMAEGPPIQRAALRALAQGMTLKGVLALIARFRETDDTRLKVVVRRTSGFVYYVSVAGVTGVKSADAATVAPAVARIRVASGLPVAVGFGIKTPEQAAAIARIADAAVVGSALVDEVAEAVDLNEDVTARVLSKVGALAKAVRLARQGLATV